MEPEVNPEEQTQEVHLMVKGVPQHHYKDDPFLCNLLNQASVKITENTTNEALELESEGTNHSVSSDQPITIRIDGANELFKALKDVYRIKLAPLPKKWRHHDMPFVTDDKIDDMDEPDFEGPPTLSDVTAAFDGIYHGLQKYDYVSFP